MKTILLYVVSLDGKITKWGKGTLHEWVSVEDQEHFLATLKKSEVIVMGSNTFKAVHPQPSPDNLRIVMTRTPEKFQQFTVSGQLEFTNEAPSTLLERLKKNKYKQLALVSGSKLTTVFLQNMLVDEIWVTIEPKLFGVGKDMINNKKLDIQLQLVNVQKINSVGTLLLKYKVVK